MRNANASFQRRHGTLTPVAEMAQIHLGATKKTTQLFQLFSRSERKIAGNFS
jgi:hypothetical protein